MELPDQSAHGKLGDAERRRDLLERPLAIEEHEFGAEHREVAVALANLGTAYCSLGDAEGERNLLERAQAFVEREYGA